MLAPSLLLCVFVSSVGAWLQKQPARDLLCFPWVVSFDGAGMYWVMLIPAASSLPFLVLPNSSNGGV